MPTVVQDPISGNVTAFVTDGIQVSAVSLGSVSGLVLWTQTGEFGCQSIPTVVGNSIVLVGPGQYYAFDQVTGAANHFWSGGVSGGGGSTVAYDATRQQFYVLEDYDPDTTLSAYHYADNFHIKLLWQRTGDGVGYGGSVAIGPRQRLFRWEQHDLGARSCHRDNASVHSGFVCKWSDAGTHEQCSLDNRPDSSVRL